ncbi:Uncharacterised protein [Serratia proteamaculans]|nr:Uncharacterised protein [Serratia proteamaculans]
MSEAALAASFFSATHHKLASPRFKSLSLHFFDASRTKVVRNI